MRYGVEFDRLTVPRSLRSAPALPHRATRGGGIPTLVGPRDERNHWSTTATTAGIDLGTTTLHAAWAGSKDAVLTPEGEAGPPVAVSLADPDRAGVPALSDLVENPSGVALGAKPLLGSPFDDVVTAAALLNHNAHNLCVVPAATARPRCLAVRSVGVWAGVFRKA